MRIFPNDDLFPEIIKNLSASLASMNRDENYIPSFSPVLKAFDDYVINVRLVYVLFSMTSDESINASQFGSCINSTIDEWRNLTTRNSSENDFPGTSKHPTGVADELPIFLAKVRRDKSLVERLLSMPTTVTDAPSKILESLGEMRSLLVSGSEYLTASVGELEETNRTLEELVYMTKCDIESVDAVSFHSSITKEPDPWQDDRQTPSHESDGAHVGREEFATQERFAMTLCDNESTIDRLQRKQSLLEQAIAENRIRSFEVPDVDTFANECVALHTQIRCLEKALESEQVRIEDEQSRAEAASRKFRLETARRDVEREVQSRPIPPHLIDRTSDAALVIQTHLRALKARQTYVKLMTAKKK